MCLHVSDQYLKRPSFPPSFNHQASVEVQSPLTTHNVHVRVSLSLNYIENRQHAAYHTYEPFYDKETGNVISIFFFFPSEVNFKVNILTTWYRKLLEVLC